MVGLIILFLLLAGCDQEVKVVYKCPKGQVMVLEDRGTAAEVERCYTPGVSYTDYRPLIQERV